MPIFPEPQHQIGEIVYIKDSGGNYPNYYTFFERNHMPKEYYDLWIKDSSEEYPNANPLETPGYFKIIAIGYYDGKKDEKPIYVIQNQKGHLFIYSAEFDNKYIKSVDSEKQATLKFPELDITPPEPINPQIFDKLFWKGEQ